MDCTTRFVVFVVTGKLWRCDPKNVCGAVSINTRRRTTGHVNNARTTGHVNSAAITAHGSLH